MQQEAIEIQLWEYLDGTCTVEEKARISGLIATDARWKTCYDELISFDQGLRRDMVAEKTTSGFTDNVIAVLDASTSQFAARKRMLTLSIRAIAAFFIVSIVLLLTYALVDAGSLSFSPSEYQLPEIHVPELQLPSYAPFIAGLLAVIMLLAVGDNILRGKNTHRA